MATCSKCQAGVLVPDGHDFDEEIDLCYQCLYERCDELELRMLKIGQALELAVCTEGCDKGVVILSQDSPCHPERIKCEKCDGRSGGICSRCGGVDSYSVTCYDHEYFSPLGDALIAAWELCVADPAHSQPESPEKTTSESP